MDGELHFSSALVSAFEDEVITAKQFARTMLWHFERCPECARAMERWRQGKPDDQRLPLLSLTRRGVFTISPEERERAKQELDEIVAVSPKSEQRRRISRANKRFRSPYLAELLIYESWDELGLDPKLSLHLVELSILVLGRDLTSARTEELQVLALASKAAARKALGELDAAGELFRQSRSLAEEIELSDISIVAHLDRLEGGYLKDRRELDSAEGCLRRALRLYEVLEETTLAARTRLSLALCLALLDRFFEAVGLTEEALKAIDPDDEPFLAFAATHNIPLFLCEAGRYQEAGELLRANLDIYKRIAVRKPAVTGDFHWLAGKIKRGMGDVKGAIPHLELARDNFLSHAVRYETVLVCLDMALAKLELGEHAEVRELVAVMVPSYAADALHQEAFASLRLLAEAARRETISANLIQRTYRFLEVGRRDPALSFTAFEAMRS